MVSWLSAAALGLGCSAVQFVGDDPASKRSMLEIDCEPAEAILSVDGQPIGVVMQFRGQPVPVESGKLRVELSHDGYYPYLLDLDARPGRVYRLELDLIRNLDEEELEP